MDHFSKFTTNAKNFEKNMFENTFIYNSFDDMVESTMMDNRHKFKMIIVNLLSASFIIDIGFVVTDKNDQNYFGKNGEL